jgi:tRNA pseudouridine38-40 synthase
MRNISLLIAYDGTDFRGWQRQPNELTVQECLESAIERILGAKAHLWGSGRTDSGVHALNQTANFKTDCRIPCRNLVKALNDTLPPTVRIREAHDVNAKFHARYDVRSKTYRYRILQAPVCSPFLWRFVWHYPFPLDGKRMAQAARLFAGEHDFTSFAAVDASGAEEERPGQSQARTASPEDGGNGRQPAAHKAERGMVRTIFATRILRRSRTSMLIYEVSGNGFLHHMVRNIVGTLVEVGRGKLEPSDTLRILKARDRTQAGPTAPAQGLCLMRVEY